MSTRTGSPRPTDEEFESGWQRWHLRRLAAVNAPDGPPTLAGTYWLDETDTVPGASGRWWCRDGDVLLSLPEGGAVVVDGVPQSGELVALANGDEAGPRIHFADVTAQVTTRCGRRGVRVFEHSGANAVSRIDAFAPSTDWLIEASYAPLPGQPKQSYDFALESGPRELDSPGVVSFTIGDTTYETRPFLDEGKLLLVFSDATSGVTTKPPSRFLIFPIPGTGLDEAASLTLDFNRAFLPPCAFSDHFNCPLPPAAHRFAVAVTAGETWATVVSSEL